MIPDHSAFSRARNERFRDSDHVFERVVEACIAAGLVGGEGFAVDASLIVADANKQRWIPGPEWEKRPDPETASRAVKEYLATLDYAAFGVASDRSGRTMDGSDEGCRFLCLSRQLSDRRKVRRHPRRQGLPCAPSEGWRLADDDRANGRTLCPEAKVACGRYGLRFRSQS
jgi:hypothetical protein